jgi:hypothetical protein
MYFGDDVTVVLSDLTDESNYEFHDVTVVEPHDAARRDHGLGADNQHVVPHARDKENGEEGAARAIGGGARRGVVN